MKQKLGLAVAAILLVCGWHARFYDRVTWYGEAHRGKLMANGRPFNPDALTAASWNYPLGSKLRLVYGSKSVLVEVTDRGGARARLQFGKVVDLSQAAFARLERPRVGSIRVKITLVEQAKRSDGTAWALGSPNRAGVKGQNAFVPNFIY